MTSGVYIGLRLLMAWVVRQAEASSNAVFLGAGFAAAGSSPRSQYLQKRRLQFSVGSRGSEPGSFTWPRGIAVGPDNIMVVADSSNHRVQVSY